MQKNINKIIFLFIMAVLTSCFNKPLGFQRHQKDVYYARDMNGYKFVTTGLIGTITLLSSDGQFVEEYYVTKEQTVYYFKAPDSGPYYALVHYGGKDFRINLFF